MIDEPLSDGAAPAVADEGAPPPGADGEAEEVAEPIELLVQLAEEGEIDPWNIDIVHVTDEFLERLDRGDLRASARALFYASVLLRMKSDALLAPPEPEEPEPEPWEAGWEGEEPWDDPDAPIGDPLANLEHELDRRLDRKRARGSPQTLDELVRELREVERDSWWKDSRTYDTSESPRGFRRGTQTLDYRASDDLRMEDEPTEEDVTGTAHGEHIEDIIDAVWAALSPHYEAGRAEVLFEEVSTAGGSRAESFLGLLFLAHRGRVRLEQDELFDDLWIARSDDDAAGADVEDEASGSTADEADPGTAVRDPGDGADAAGEEGDAGAVADPEGTVDENTPAGTAVARGDERAGADPSEAAGTSGEVGQDDGRADHVEDGTPD